MPRLVQRGGDDRQGVGWPRGVSKAGEGQMFEGWGSFVAAMLVFFLSHLIPARPGLRAVLVRGMGHAGYGTVYGLISLAVLTWVIVAAGRAPVVVLWDQALWQRWVANGAMGLAVLLASFAVAAVNPFSFGGRRSGFAPEHPGIAGVCRHPLLLALLIWALAHLLVNGDLAHALVFGPFAGFAALGMLVIDRRNRRLWGAAEWARLTARTSLLPFAALVQRRWRPVAALSLLRLGVGLLVWVGLLGLHPIVIGISPLP
ncbi:MAG: NnrU family protein [Pseudorhodobacter sp.]|nr:NnrU family protein [Pseudorhodobacter sp.]